MTLLELKIVTDDFNKTKEHPEGILSFVYKNNLQKSMSVKDFNDLRHAAYMVYFHFEFETDKYSSDMDIFNVVIKSVIEFKGFEHRYHQMTIDEYEFMKSNKISIYDNLDDVTNLITKEFKNKYGLRV